MWHRAAILLVLSSLLLVPTANGAPPATAVTGGVTAIAATSALLHGTVNTTSADSEWFFQYGKSAGSLTQHTAPTSVSAVSSRPEQSTISSLSAGTKYFYRLVVIENVSNSSPNESDGGTLSFTTNTSGGGGGGGNATTGNATSITSTSATLNGVAAPGSADSEWSFQYGPSKSYGRVTQAQTIGTGVHAVTKTVTGLKPGTTYHFRLVVNEGSYPSTTELGVDHTFTTKLSPPPPKKKYGRASLVSRRLKVHRGKVAIAFRCKGAAKTACKGRVSITARGKVGKRVRTVHCGSAKLSLTAGKSKTVRARIGHGCAVLLAKAKKHKIKAKLKATFSTHQKQLKSPVTLIRR
jgi:hypothetical protein